MSSGLRAISLGAQSNPQTTEEEMKHVYKAVYVFLCSWEEDDLGVKDEVDRLQKVFYDFYGF